MRAGQYRRALDRISRNVADVARTVGRYLGTTERTDADLDDAARVLHPAIVAGREQARQAAITFTQAQARLQGYQGTVPVPAPREYAEESTKKALKEVTDDAGGDLEKAVARTAVRHTEDAARKTVEDVSTMSEKPDPAGGEREPIRWARQLTGAENCPFCVIMASRGAVYLSRNTAMGDVERKNNKNMYDGINRYHNGCDCVAVPVYDWNNWEGRKTAQYLYAAVYQKALETYPDQDAFEAVRLYMVHDLKSDELKVPQLRNDEVDVPDQAVEDVPDFVSDDLLSQETKDLIDGTADRLPDTKEEWETIRKQSGATQLEIRREDQAKYHEQRAKDLTKRAKDYDSWSPTNAEKDRAQAKADRALAKKYRAGKEDDLLLKQLDQMGVDPNDSIGYNLDKDGKILPPQSYLDRVDEVQKVGYAALDDYKRALDTDGILADLIKARDDAERELEVRMQEVIRLQREGVLRRSAARSKVDEDLGVDDWLEAMSKAEEDATEVEFDRALEIAQERGEEARLAVRAARDEATARRGELLRQLVGSRRPMAEDGDMTVAEGKTNPKGAYGYERPAAEEDIAKIRRASTFFPKSWVEKMEATRGALYATTSNRAYYRAKSPFSNVPGDQINVSKNGGNYRRGAFTDYTEQIAAHEIGHRMEKTLPAIARLEWAYLYRRATSKGKREALKWVGSGAKDEKAFHDGFRSAYTGKSYGDPDQRPWEYDSWEVFTTGLESLYGDDASYQDTDGDLQSFILGILLTVGGPV